MNRTQLISRVRIIVRDFGSATFRDVDIYEFLNEGIERCGQVIVELECMTLLATATDVPTLLPTRYHQLLAIYASARCQFQDERHFQATTLMNEFEFKLQELKAAIEGGEVQIVDGDGVVVVNDNEVDFVETESYWGDNHTGDFITSDIDLGVEGVE